MTTIHRTTGRAISCAFACALALAGCGGDPNDANQQQGVPTPVAAQCDSQWRLAPGFRLGIDVDYVADRLSADPDDLISEHGEACATAKQRSDCEAALALSTDVGRHLVTTQGDTVQLWTMPALGALGEIDTPEEAIWLALADGYRVKCDAKLSFDDGKYSIAACLENHHRVILHVDSHGIINSLVVGPDSDC